MERVSRKKHRCDADADDDNWFRAVKTPRREAVDADRGERRNDNLKQSQPDIKMTKTTLPCARSISYYAEENLKLKEELRRMTVQRTDLVEL